MDLAELIASEELHLKKLDQLVRDSIEEEALLSHRLHELENDDAPSLADRLTDRVAQFGGSWAFVLLSVSVILVWVTTNVIWYRNQGFDPYPFILLNLILSCVAALQAPIIMMSQNRQEEKDRRRARSDFMINLKSELEVRSLHSKIDLLIAEQMKTLLNVQQTQVELLISINERLNQGKSS